MRAILGAVGLSIALAAAAAATPITYQTTLSGANENPSNGSTATGTATVIYDPVAHTLDVSVVFSGLSAAAVAGHIHCCFAAPTNSIVATPLSALPAATSGSFQETLDLTLLSTYSAAFLSASGGTAAGAEAGLASGLAGGIAYVNLHTSNFPNGEIRGYLVAAPEPGICALLAAGTVALAARRRR